MSDRAPNSRGRHNGTTFILSCLRTVFSELSLHGRWLPAEQLRLYMHMKCQIGNGIVFSLATMMRVINKVLPLANFDPNIIEIANDSALRVFRYSFQNRTRRHFFWVAAKIGVMPSFPSKGNALSWEQDAVLTRLLFRSICREQPIIDLACDSSTAGIPQLEAKQPKTATNHTCVETNQMDLIPVTVR